MAAATAAAAPLAAAPTLASCSGIPSFADSFARQLPVVARRCLCHPLSPAAGCGSPATSRRSGSFAAPVERHHPVAQCTGFAHSDGDFCRHEMDATAGCGIRDADCTGASRNERTTQKPEARVVPRG